MKFLCRFFGHIPYTIQVDNANKGTYRMYRDNPTFCTRCGQKWEY